MISLFVGLLIDWFICAIVLFRYVSMQFMTSSGMGWLGAKAPGTNDRHLTPGRSVRCEEGPDIRSLTLVVILKPLNVMVLYARNSNLGEFVFKSISRKNNYTVDFTKCAHLHYLATSWLVNLSSVGCLKRSSFFVRS